MKGKKQECAEEKVVVSGQLFPRSLSPEWIVKWGAVRLGMRMMRFANEIKFILFELSFGEQCFSPGYLALSLQMPIAVRLLSCSGPPLVLAVMALGKCLHSSPAQTL